MKFDDKSIENTMGVATKFSMYLSLIESGMWGSTLSNVYVLVV